MPPDDIPPESSTDAGDTGALPSAEGDALETTGEQPRIRRFGAWGAAQSQESEPSLWHRASQKLKGLFTRSKPEEPEPEDGVETLEDMQPVAAGDDQHESSAADEAGHADAPVEEPKEDLKFLWTADEAAAPVETVAEPADEPADEPIAEAPRAKRPSFLQRLFGRKAKPETDEDVPDTGESEVPEPASAELAETQAVDVGDVPTLAATQPLDLADVSFLPATQAIDLDQVPTSDDAEPPVEAAALDEALPMDGPITEPFDIAAVGAAEAEPVSEPTAKPGFFARLFGRKTGELPPPADLAVDAEAEPDAVGQLDAVDEGFAAARSEFAPPEVSADQSFVTVDDALPLDTPTLQTQPAVTEWDFAPPPVGDVTLPGEATLSGEATLPPPPAVSSGQEHEYFGGNTFDFESPAVPDSRSTLEVSSVDDSRKTAEVSAHAEEVERKTDEFDMVTIQEPAVSPLEGKTAEAPKVSFIKKLFGKTKEVTQVEPAVAPPPSANPTFLVQKFRTFYNEVVVYRSQKAEFAAGFSTAIVTDYSADLSPEQSANSLSVRLHQMLELQLAESSWMGGEIAELYPDAQYAMAVLGDEMLSNLEWPGQGAWGKHRLELTVFKTTASDLELFKRVDKLLKNGPRTVGTRDLARVYLLTIASGFKGKFRPFDLPRALAEYRRRLYEFVYGGDALLLYGEERRIFPEAESVTVKGKAVSRFSMAQQWAAVLVMLLVGYTVISQMTWSRVSADLKDMAGRVEQARTATTAPPNPNGGGGH